MIDASIRLEPGVVFYEYYFEDAPYALWQIFDPHEQRLLCWYCNIETPAIVTGDLLVFKDLLLDLLLLPNGETRPLDREEMEQAKASGMSLGLVRLAEEGLSRVEDLIHRGDPPFDQIARPPTWASQSA